MDEQSSEAMAMIEEASAEYLGKWNRLVSTTNWEKGRIICQWREALQEAGAEPASLTDDAWSRQVGSVSPQHVGRLRRVYQQFGEVRGQYSGLYWSHFQAALEWPDPELWLEGAVQNGWSVAEMRQRRGEAMGMAPEAAAAAAEAAVAEELEEDAPEAENSGLPAAIEPTTEAVRNPDDEEDDAEKGEPRSQRSSGRRGSANRGSKRRRSARCGRSRVWPRCRPTWPTRSSDSSWRSCITALPAGTRSPANMCWTPWRP